MRIRKTLTATLALSLLFSVAGFILGGTVNALATEAESEIPVVEEMEEEIHDPSGIGLPTATTEEISQWTERKGFEIIGVLQRFVQPFAIVVFIGCAILTLIGAFGNGKMVSKGLVGMITSLIMYVVVLYAPEIMDTFLNFVRT